MNLKGLVVWLVRSEPDLMGVLDELCQVLRVQRIQHREEVISRWALLAWVGIGEVAHHDLVLREERVDGLDGELVELGHVDELAVGDGQQLLLVAKDLLEEVFVDHLARRDQQLD